MVAFDNPIATRVFWRFAGPLVPLWMAGAAFVVLLERTSGAGPTLSGMDLAVLLAVYSLLVAAMVAALYTYEYRRSPAIIELGYDGITGRFARSSPPPVAVEYAEIRNVVQGGFFPPRVEALSPGGGQIVWLNLTDENAARLVEAWTAWRERQRPSS